MNEITNPTEWNELVLKAPPKSGAFLHSWEWGEFQHAVGRKIYRFTKNEYVQNVAIAINCTSTICQAIEYALPLQKKYWFVPRGNLTDGLKEEARKRGALFVRFEPEKTPERPSVVTTHVSPPTTLILDLSKSEDELLASMHEKTRYNIRLALRKGVKIEPRSQNLEPSCFEIFWKLLEETARRDGFRTHPKSYYQKMLTLQSTVYSLQSTACFTELWIAEWEGKPLATGIWVYFGDTITYLHGASSGEHRDLMAPYALHWEVMRDAKARGYHYYDFWGINPTSYKLQATSLWKGITRFKMGFGGEVVAYPGTYDLPIQKVWYRLYTIARGLRRGKL